MKKLNELFNCEYDIEVTGIKTNSQNLQNGEIFVCTDMGTMDRHLFIDDAIKKGASAIVVKKDVGTKSIPIFKVDNPNQELARLCAIFYDYPQNDMQLISVTGTDGKTSVATIIQTLIGKDKVGYIGTNGINCKFFEEKTSNTTPDIDKLLYHFNEFKKHGIKTVSMEVSSEALLYNRTNTLEFDCSIMTNITKEHLNVHKTLENYIECKSKLFKNTKKDGYCILNIDDEHYLEILKACNGQVKTYGSNQAATLYYKNVTLKPNKTLFTIVYDQKEYLIESPMLALFNVYNLCACLLALLTLGHKIEDLLSNIKNIKVPGRLQVIDKNQNFHVMIDYAHTPNGISKLLEFIHTLKFRKLIVVFSEPGQRDRSKRADKGYNVITNCDHAIITSQDPRNEDPIVIANDLIERVKDRNNYEIVLNRSEAIKKAIFMAKKDDMVLIIGKGNETYQIIGDNIIYFCDIDEAEKYLIERKNLQS